MKNIFFALWTKYYEWLFGFRKTDASGKLSRVYMFHTVSDAPTDPRKFVSNIRGFEKFISAETAIRTPEALPVLVNQRKDNCFSVTFDDVYDCIYTCAYPVLKKYQIPFTLFIATDFLDQPGYLTTAQLKEMADDPLCTVGAHTKSHPRLRTAEDAAQQIRESAQILQELLQRKIVLFAYPYGSILCCSQANTHQAKAAGYTAAFSAMRGYLNKNAFRHRFFLPRLNGDHYVIQLETEECL